MRGGSAWGLRTSDAKADGCVSDGGGAPGNSCRDDAPVGLRRDREGEVVIGCGGGEVSPRPVPVAVVEVICEHRGERGAGGVDRAGDVVLANANADPFEQVTTIFLSAWRDREGSVVG